MGKAVIKIIGQPEVISKVFFFVQTLNLGTELTHYVRILRYLRSNSRKMSYFI